NTRRGWCDIVADILSSAKEGERVTEIMYRTKLSYPHMKEYLKLLEDSGLLNYSNDSSTYKTTKTGLLVLKRYKEFRDLVFSDGR
ncbi:MAG: winged helix-turn-helix domain-containing protein, partial [Thermoproteota archaeon]